MEEVYVVEETSTTKIKIIRDLPDLIRKGRNDFYVIARIRGNNLNVENWGTSANEELFSATERIN